MPHAVDPPHGEPATRLRLGIDAALARHDRVVDLLGPLLDPSSPPQWVHRAHGRRVADGYAADAASLFELTTDLAACDVAVFPVGWDQSLLEPSLVDAARRFCADAALAGKVVVVFVDGDDHVPAPADNTVVLRTSLDRSLRGPRDVALPAWIADPGLQPPRPHRDRPVVGFCGQAYPLDLPRRRVLKRAKLLGRVALTRAGLVERIGKHPAFLARPRAVRALARATEVEPRITLRSSMTRLDLDTRRERELYEEFVASLTESDYVLSVRGEGNYSYRLYETLAAGRIPVHVDTGAVLPLESVVPWADLCVVVPERRVRGLGAATAAAHTAMGADGFARRQAAARQAWEEWLSMRGYFRTLHARLAAAIRTGASVDPAELASSLR